MILSAPTSLLFVCYRGDAALDDLDRWLELPRAYAWVVLGQVLLWPALFGLFHLWRRSARPRSFLGPKKLLLGWASTVVITLICAVPGGVYWMDRAYELRMALAERAKAEVDLKQLARDCLSLLDDKNAARFFARPKPGEVPPLIASLRPISVELTADSVEILVVMRYFSPEDNEGFYFSRGKGVGSLSWYHGFPDTGEILLKMPGEDLREKGRSP